MLNKIFYSMILLFGLTACATQSVPQTATAPKYDAALLLGKWQCSSQLDEDTTVSSISTIHANGTSEGQHIVKINLNEKLAWRFSVDMPTTWRLDGDQYFEKQATQPKAKILPAESQSEALALRTFEKKNKLAKLKEETRKGFEEFDDKETALKIVELNRQLFVSEFYEDGKAIRINCQRI